MQSREFKAGRRNQLVLDDTQDQIQTQLSSDHGLSQLNLGYITRVNHIEGRKDFRGEGFELRTDDWGVVRAGKGIYSTTHPRMLATKHQKDFDEGVSGIAAAVNFHKELGELAEKHSAHTLSDDVKPVHTDLDTQKAEISGTGKQHGELTKPHVVVAAAAGIASTAVGSHHMHTGAHAAITAEKNITLAAGKSLLGSFLDKICLFAHKAGIKLFAASGKVQIQAQSDQVEIIADQSARVVSLKNKVEVAAAKEILLTAGGSYIRISKNGIEQGTAGKWAVHAADRSMDGPKTHNKPMLDLPITGYTRDVEMVFSDMFGRGLKSEPISLSNGSDFDLVESTDGTGKVSLKNIILSSLSVIQSTRK
ncbi:MAG: type VI secretion system tip protein VgrG [Desulfovibrio sp.]|nr:type VI secretion system tip protein VgrG [Desulfovibrio sp.]